jgi:glucokinase
VPGAVLDGTCQTTNLPWHLSDDDLQRTLGIATVRLVNDLQAAALGMLHLDDDALVVLNPGHARDRRRNLGVIAAGTGLGEALLVFDGERHIPMASEGGHTSFAPTCDLDVELHAFLSARHGAGGDEGDGRVGHVSWERVLSGPGLVSLYAFLVARGEAPCADVEARLVGGDAASAIGIAAVNGTDTTCLHAVQHFCRLYGAEAGNLALKTLATGGVYVGGGIAPKILPLLRDGFFTAFAAKGRFGSLLARIPIKVVLNDSCAILGAARAASRAAAGASQGEVTP